MVFQLEPAQSIQCKCVIWQEEYIDAYTLPSVYWWFRNRALVLHSFRTDADKQRKSALFLPHWNIFKWVENGQTFDWGGEVSILPSESSMLHSPSILPVNIGSVLVISTHSGSSCNFNMFPCVLWVSYTSILLQINFPRRLQIQMTNF